jgi:XRE family aerobic/anaerobic benzoate catabolism transcriptional regulator
MAPEPEHSSSVAEARVWASRVLYSAFEVAKAQYNAARAEHRATFLTNLGRAVRARRSERGLTLKALAESAHLSVRFLLQLEAGVGNVSVGRLLDIAEALGTKPAELLASLHEQPTQERRGIVALLGLRGAGKSTLGALAAKELGVPFVELDALVAKHAGMSLPVIFEVHGEAYFRRVEREALRKFLDETDRAVLATSGSIVTDKETFALLRKRTRTIWLRADPGDHLRRVVAQGDLRPMQGRPAASRELGDLLRARRHLYAQADATIETSTLGPDRSSALIVELSREIGPTRVRRTTIRQ